MNPRRSPQGAEDRALTIEEIRMVSDLRIMHAKVDEQLVDALKKRHSEADIVKICRSVHPHGRHPRLAAGTPKPTVLLMAWT
jgi:hypothetical protein